MTSPYHQCTVFTPAASPAVDISFIKANTRVDITADDTLIAGMIAAATESAEIYTRRAFITTTFLLTMDSFPNSLFGYNNNAVSSVVWLPRADVISVDEISYEDTNGNSQELDSDEYHYGTGANVRLVPSYNKSWPSHRAFYDSVKIKFTCGYGDTSDDVPFAAKLAIAHIVDHWYVNRSSVESGAFQEVPQSGYNLLDQISWGRW